MKMNKIFVFLSFIFIILMCISSVSALDNDNNITMDSSNPDLGLDDESNLNVDGKLSLSEDVELSSTVVVDEVEPDHNEMTDPTIQKAINEAKSGDTIIVNGSSYVHCHFIIDKNLTIISSIGTTMTPCSSTQGSGYRGIFYISPSASGTVIEGFNIMNDVSNSNDYGIFVNGASNVLIKNCTFSNKRQSADAIRFENANNCIVENVTISDNANGIRIKNSQNTKVTDSYIHNAKYGVYIIDSTKTNIMYNIISNNRFSGVAIADNCIDTTVHSNNITDNDYGVESTSANNVFILNNYIAFNTRYGVYTNCNITKMEIKGNFINQNGQFDIFNDHRVKNLFVAGGEKLQIIDNNYMIGHAERPVWRQVYEYKGPGEGDFTYDSANDVYNYVGDGNGDYYGHQSGTFLQYVFAINEMMSCPNIYYFYPNEGQVKPWMRTGNYNLYLSEITQEKKGVYSISIVDVDGNIAKDISSVPVTFYLNKNNTEVSPQEYDVYKIVMLKNGTATVRFYPDEFNATGNKLLASFPGIGDILYSKANRPYKTLDIDDKDIPGNITETKLSVSNLNTYPNSNAVLQATLTDLEGNPISGEIITFSFNSKTYDIATDNSGKASLKVSISKEGTYVVGVKYAGDDVEYGPSSSQASVAVKKVASRIISSNVPMIPKMAEYYSITLKDASGKCIANQRIVFKVNKRTYVAKTNKNGVAKIYLKFNVKGNYRISISYAGSNIYKSSSRNNVITVKYSSKVAKLDVPKVTITPNTVKTYVITLKDANGKGIAKQKITFTINGKKYTKLTNAKGQVYVKVKFSKLCSYKVSTSYKGNNIYKKAAASGRITVAKTATKFTAPKLTATPNEQKTYTVTLKTGAGKALAKQRITITVNGKTYAKTTNAKGQVSLILKFANEKKYPVVLKYNGNAIYKPAKATGSFNVAKVSTVLTSHDKTYSIDSNKTFSVTLKDNSGNALANKLISFTFNDKVLTKATDANGVAGVDLDGNAGVYDITSGFDGDNTYKSVTNINKITISNKTDVTFVDEGLSSSEIQGILDSCPANANVEFVGDTYSDIALTINKPLNIYSENYALLKSKSDNPVFNVVSSNVNISGMIIIGKSSNALELNNADNVNIFNNSIKNTLDESKIPEYSESTVPIPGYGISVSNSTEVTISDNSIEVFESGIFAQNSSHLNIRNNVLRENNYGIKYGFGVSNTEIISNFITESIGLYTDLVPEGPRGYGIFLNNSAVNVTILNNDITWNHLGISIDSNYSTGIVIKSNLISDNVLEGIRFNAGYDLAENAVEPVVTDNAIYRNARGPSLMILGEMSANPGGIYGAGEWNESLRLKIGPNWYGKNAIKTWDNDTGIVGYGTMCPRISTTPIVSGDLVYCSSGNYSVLFYKNGTLADELSVFNLFAVLNRGTDNQVEIGFDVVNGIGTFSFDGSDFNSTNNVISLSSVSIFDESRLSIYDPFYVYDVPDSEIPA